MSEVSLVDGHIDNGMSDEDIIKALEYCSKQGITSECESCKYKKGCRTELINDALKLIDCYKAENEKLNIELKAMRGAANSYKAEVEKNKIRIRDLTNYQVADVETRKKVVAKAKSEAIKEFADRLKKGMCFDRDYNDLITTEKYIKKVVKEMTESK